MKARIARRRRVTLNDVAKAARVSRATVSLVVRASALVHPETRASVLEHMRRLGYVYNRLAANLRRQHSSNVALVINDLSNPFSPSLRRAWMRRWAPPGT
jgi:LacI family transcriptional regulator